jgi:hypothetical protein
MQRRKLSLQKFNKSKDKKHEKDFLLIFIICFGSN